MAIVHGPTRMPLAQIRALAQSVGFPDPELAASVAQAESSGDPDAIGDMAITPPFGSVGLWQINLHAHPDFDPDTLHDPTTNAQAALQVSRGGMVWSPWTTYRTGANAKYLSPSHPQRQWWASVQRQLNALGASPPLVIDGKPGALTQAAVKQVQAQSGVAVDGKVGPQTLALLGIGAFVPGRAAPAAAPVMDVAWGFESIDGLETHVPNLGKFMPPWQKPWIGPTDPYATLYRDHWGVVRAHPSKGATWHFMRPEDVRSPYWRSQWAGDRTGFGYAFSATDLKDLQRQVGDRRAELLRAHSFAVADKPIDPALEAKWQNLQSRAWDYIHESLSWIGALKGGAGFTNDQEARGRQLLAELADMHGAFVTAKVGPKAMPLAPPPPPPAPLDPGYGHLAAKDAADAAAKAAKATMPFTLPLAVLGGLLALVILKR
ncbi:MAG: peptidoglycan-binding protein [Polyangiaceae bacterium]|nr:peptidoglycan-binding protein [Polyangiaceae bacterium]